MENLLITEVRCNCRIGIWRVVFSWTNDVGDDVRSSVINGGLCDAGMCVILSSISALFGRQETSHWENTTSQQK